MAKLVGFAVLQVCGVFCCATLDICVSLGWEENVDKDDDGLLLGTWSARLSVFGVRLKWPEGPSSLLGHDALDGSAESL